MAIEENICFNECLSNYFVAKDNGSVWQLQKRYAAGMPAVAENICFSEFLSNDFVAKDNVSVLQLQRIYAAVNAYRMIL